MSDEFYEIPRTNQAWVKPIMVGGAPIFNIFE